MKRKIDSYLIDWKQNVRHKPLIIKGARQIGKTYSVLEFAHKHYRSVVEINFVLQPQYRNIFDNGYEVDAILKNITMINPMAEIVPGETLIFFDELQHQPAAATSLKSFHLDGRYDVICSGSLMGINYREIESNSVGYKEDYEMFSMDFEEFLWAKGYPEELHAELLRHMLEVSPLSTTQMTVLEGLFRDYMVVGGMPAVVKRYVTQGNFSGVLGMQKQLLLDYQEDITKYAVGLDKAKVKAVYDHISVFLAQENKKFQVTKIGRNARNRDYVGTVDWLKDAGIVNVCYCMNEVALPLKGNYVPSIYKVYHQDTGLLVASLDDEAQEDLRQNRNFNTYKGAIFENVVAEALRKQGYGLYYYRNEKSTLEMDFFVRNTHGLIPIEVKVSDSATKSLRKLLDKNSFPDVTYGIKLCRNNIGFNGQFYTFPYFLAFLLHEFVMSSK